jgi:two-component system NtrC family sensor kinase
LILDGYSYILYKDYNTYLIGLLMSLFLRPTSLIFKIIIITSLILIVAISSVAWIDIRLHQFHIERLTYEKTKIISEFIENNVIRSMERGRHFDIQRILKIFSVYKGISKIHLFWPDGTIKASTDNDELNKKIWNAEFFLKNQSFIREEMIRHENGRNGKERIYYFNQPILNKPECFHCHEAKKRVIAVLTVANSLRDMDGEISKVKKDSVILAIITIGSLSFVLGFLLLRFLSLPIKKLTDTMKMVEQGDLNARVNVKGKDEMGRLAENLNTMIEKLHLAKKEAEQYHRELVRRADRMASIGELASGIAHEIRNPLTGILGAIQILAEAFPKEDGRRQVTDEIQKQIYKMERLVKDLLNYAKPVPTNYLSTDINALIDNVLSFFVIQQGGSKDLRIEKDFFSPLPQTLIDPNSMEQAFLNIILNAQKAMPKGGTLTILTRPVNRKDEGVEIKEIQIIFEDTGIGIPGSNLSKIFNPFFSTYSDGTGLGLSITKNIVEQHGGTMEVGSQVNVGTRFTITLPVIRG